MKEAEEQARKTELVDKLYEEVVKLHKQKPVGRRAGAKGRGSP